MLQDREIHPLDARQVLEPVDPLSEDLAASPEPLVRDVEGRLWRIRRRTRLPEGVALVALCALACAIVLLAFLALGR